MRPLRIGIERRALAQILSAAPSCGLAHRRLDQRRVDQSATLDEQAARLQLPIHFAEQLRAQASAQLLAEAADSELLGNSCSRLRHMKHRKHSQSASHTSNRVSDSEYHCYS